MKVLFSDKAMSTRFDDRNLVGFAGLVPTMRLGLEAGLVDLGDELVCLPTDKGANAGSKIGSLVAGMVCGADSIDDMNLLRHGGMKKLFDRVYAPSTLGSFLRTFTYGHVSQLLVVAQRFLMNLVRLTKVIDVAGSSYAVVDVDDTIIETYGKKKQGERRNVHKGVRGLNVLLATLSTSGSSGVIVNQRLRNGAANSQKGAGSFVTSAIRTTKQIIGDDVPVVLRVDSGFTGTKVVHAAQRLGVDVSVTVRWFGPVVRAVAPIGEMGWQTVRVPNGVDTLNGKQIREYQVNEVDYTMFSSMKRKKGDPDPRVKGRLIVRRNLDPEQKTKKTQGQDPFCDGWRYYAFFTTVPKEVMDTITIDKLHRQRAFIEQVNADLKNSALAHLPSGKYAANFAWLILAAITYNLIRATGCLAGGELTQATTNTIRTKLIRLPARIATSARRLTIHLPEKWPWETEWQRFYHTIYPP